MWEFDAYGGGAIYAQVFNAVAMLSGANAMDSLLRLAMVLGVCMAIVKAVFDFHIGQILKWFIFATVIYGVLWVPKVTVNVVDRLNPAAIYPQVANVPLGVGAAASMISQIGDRMISLTQTAFADPADLEYSSHGMIFGAKMFSKINSLRTANQLVAQNLMSYMRNCAFYDLQDGTITTQGLSTAPDLWDAVTANPNPARLAPYYNTDGTQVLKACTDDSDDVGTDMQNDSTNVQQLLYSSLSPNTPQANLATEESAVSNAVMTATGSSQDALTVIQNAVVRNSMNDSLKGYMGDGNGVLSATMADIQTQNTQKLLGVVGEEAVTNLKIVIELLFIGIFPVIFPLFLLPKIGLEMAKGYITGFFYLQLWGPMYVILHKIMMYQAINNGTSAIFQTSGQHVFNVLTMDPLAQANQDVCTLAGSMMLMIPVLAGLITKGAMSVGAQGEALLGNFRSGAEAASNEMTNGNWNLGNAQVATLSYDNITGHQHVTSPLEDNSRSSNVMGNGLTDVTWADGHHTYSMSGSSGPFSLQLGQNYGETLSTAAQQREELASNIQKADSVSRSETNSAMREVFNGTTDGSSTMSSFSHDDQKSLQDMKSQVWSQLDAAGYHTEDSKREYMNNLLGSNGQVGANGSLGLMEAGTGAAATVGGSLSKSSGHGGEQSHGSGENTQLQNSVMSTINNTAQRVQSDRALQQLDRTSANLSGRRDVNAATFANAKAVNDAYNLQMSIAHGLNSEKQDYMTSHVNLSSDATTAMVNYLRDEMRLPNGQVDEARFGRVLGMQNPEDIAEFNQMVQPFLSKLANGEADKIRSNVLAHQPQDTIQTPEALKSVESELHISQGPDGVGFVQSPAAAAAVSAGVSQATGGGHAPGHGHPGSNGHAEAPHDFTHLPGAIQMQTGTSSAVDTALAGETMDKVNITTAVLKEKEKLDKRVDLDPKITHETATTIDKMEKGQPFVMSVIKNSGPAGQAVEGAEEAIHWVDNQQQKHPDGHGASDSPEANDGARPK